jgi:hypothetical protein
MRCTSAILLSFLLLATACYAQGIRCTGSFRNSIYSYESDQTHTRFYQYLRFKAVLPHDKFSLSANMRALTDANISLPSADRFKLYSLRLDAKGLISNKLDVAVGRLFMNPGVVLGALDGMNAELTFSDHFGLQLYGGIESIFDRSFQVYKTQDSRVYGGVMEISKYFASKLQLFYMQKSDKAAIFWHLAGLNFDSAVIPKTVVRIQSHYDLEQDRLHRLMVSARNTWSNRWQTTLEYRRQFPQIYANSYFTIFTPLAYQRWRAAASYEFVADYTLQAQFQHVIFEKEQADQVYLTIGNNFGDIGLVWETGYAGDQLGLMLDAYYEVFHNLVASLYVDYTKYRVEEVYEYDNQLANAVRLAYRFNRNLSLDIEYQWLNNRYKSADSRVLNHLSFIW